MPRTLLACGLITLALAWLGPLPRLARESFAAHMTMHMAVVAVAAPFLAVALAGLWRPALAPIPASIVEFVVVWAWHLPAFHAAARHDTFVLVLEQGSFLAAGLLLWTAVCGGADAQRTSRRGAGVVALLFTSMHMTLLGALFLLAGRPLFVHPGDVVQAGSRLADQQLGGAIMLVVGGAAYLFGGVWLTSGFLRQPVRREASL